jgi:hypothetical protein
MYRTDDIWVRQTNDGITDQEHQNPIGGAVNYIYVRIRNKGCSDSSDAKVKVYWAKASSGLSWPTPWDGSITTPALMGGFVGETPTGVVSASGFTILEYSWTAPNPDDYTSFGADKAHFCILSRIETSTTSPYGMTFPETSGLNQNVRNNNNIVWKNITVAESTADGGKYASFLIGNFTDKNTKNKLVFEVPKKEASVFNWGTLTVTMDPGLFRVWAAEGKNGEGIEVLGDNKIQILNNGAFLSNINLDPYTFKAITAHVDPKPKAPNRREIYKLDAVQYLTDEGEDLLGGQNLIFKVEYDKNKTNGVIDGETTPPKNYWWIILLIIILVVIIIIWLSKKK